MKIPFTKAQASGNDFILLDNRKGKLAGSVGDFGKFAKFASRRRFSVGADGVLVLESSNEADFKMRIFNPDGSEVSMCGNGIRCSALYAFANKWCGESMKIETAAGILEAYVKDGSVMIKMAPPKNIRLDQNIGFGRTIMNLHTVNTGVPHAVHFVEGIADYPVKEMGGKVRFHKFFKPEGTNADFVEVVNNSTIRVRTYERGVEDETLACGTGVVAAALVSHLINGTKEPVSAITKSGDTVKIHFKKELNPTLLCKGGVNMFCDVYLEGKANIVFEGGMEYV